MYLIAIGWLYVALMMAVAEANHPSGTVIGAILTFLFYGLLPTALVMYLMGTPLRRKAKREREVKEEAERMAGDLAGAANAVDGTHPLAAPPDNPSVPTSISPPP